LFTDADGDTWHSYSISGNPNWITIDPNTGAISIANGGVPSNASVGGPVTITVTIDDGEGGTAQKQITINALNTSITTTGELATVTVKKDAPTSIPTNIFVDPDGDVLEFKATGLPEGLKIDPTTGMITGTLGATVQSGKEYQITITFTDNQGSIVTKTFTLTTAMSDLVGAGGSTPSSLPTTTTTSAAAPVSVNADTVIIDAMRDLNTTQAQTISVDVSNPINGMVNDFVSLAEVADIKSSLPIKTLVQDELANLDRRRFIDVAGKDPAASGRILTFNAIDQGDLIATLTETEGQRALELTSTSQGNVRIVDQFPTEGIEIAENGKVILNETLTEDIVSLTIEVDVQGTLTVRDVLINTTNGELEEISREQRGSQFTEMLNWQAVMF
jgi:hypothetical protein